MVPNTHQSPKGWCTSSYLKLKLFLPLAFPLFFLSFLYTHALKTEIGRNHWYTCLRNFSLCEKKQHSPTFLVKLNLNFVDCAFFEPKKAINKMEWILLISFYWRLVEILKDRGNLTEMYSTAVTVSTKIKLSSFLWLLPAHELHCTQLIGAFCLTDHELDLALQWNNLSFLTKAQETSARTISWVSSLLGFTAKIPTALLYARGLWRAAVPWGAAGPWRAVGPRGAAGPRGAVRPRGFLSPPLFQPTAYTRRPQEIWRWGIPHFYNYHRSTGIRSKILHLH